MLNIAIFFDNLIDYVPFALICNNGCIKVIRNFKTLVLPDDVITLGYRDCIDSLRRLGARPNQKQRRIEILYLLTIKYSKGDQPKRWNYKKQDVIGKYLDKNNIRDLKKYENGEIGWTEYSKMLFLVKDKLIEAVERAYHELFQEYVRNDSFRESWINIEYSVDNFFLTSQFKGIAVDNSKIKDTLINLNNEKYASLLLLEKEYGIDLSSAYISDLKIDEATLSECNENEKSEELADLLQVVNVDDKRIEAIAKIKECRIDYANLIKHYSLSADQKVYPQYEIIGSSSGRIFISSPGTQYLKKTKRDIFVPNDGFRIAYFDFRNYEPGIAAGLSSDKDFIDYYNSGDMYSKIAVECFNDIRLRKSVKISMLSYLYGMSIDSQKRYFAKNSLFNPEIVISLINSFTEFISWKNIIIKQAIDEKIIKDKAYTRAFIQNMDWKIRTSALNHIIQSTGSRILKQCIFKISQLESARILIPMHDALLCELSIDEYEPVCDRISTIMEKIFTDEVINTTSKVIVTNIFS